MRPELLIIRKSIYIDSRIVLILYIMYGDIILIYIIIDIKHIYMN